MTGATDPRIPYVKGALASMRAEAAKQGDPDVTFAIGPGNYRQITDVVASTGHGGDDAGQ